MFHTLSLPSFSMRALPARQVRPAQLAPLAVAGAVLAAALLVTAPHKASAPSVSADHPVATLIQSTAGSPAMLQSAGEALRAELRTVPGVGAVELRGVQTAGVEVRFSPLGLTHQGVRPAELMAAVPAQSVSSGIVTVRPDVAQDGPEPVADMQVRAGRHVMRLGDLTFVARTPLPVPVARLHRDGHPAVEVVVAPAQGEAGPALDRRVAEALAVTKLPAGIAMK